VRRTQAFTKAPQTPKVGSKGFLVYSYASVWPLYYAVSERWILLQIVYTGVFAALTVFLYSKMFHRLRHKLTSCTRCRRRGRGQGQAEEPEKARDAAGSHVASHRETRERRIETAESSEGGRRHTMVEQSSKDEEQDEEAESGTEGHSGMTLEQYRSVDLATLLGKRFKSESTDHAHKV